MTLIVRNTKQLKREFAKLEGKVQRKLARRALRAGAKAVQERAKALAPEDEGDLVREIRVRSLPRSRVTFGAAVQIDVDKVRHATFMEWGTKYIDAQRFLFQAAVEKQTEVEQIAERELNKAINEIARESRAK